MLVVSENAYDTNNPGYNPGLYCKWQIHGSAGNDLMIDFIDAHIHPKTRDCKYDGFVVLTQNDSNTSGSGYTERGKSNLNIPTD